MVKNILPFLIILCISEMQAQQVDNYSLNIHFFPDNAQMWGYPVDNESFMRGTAEVKFFDLTSDSLVFYLHGELKIDSIRSSLKRIDYSSEKVFYSEDYSYVALKTIIEKIQLIQNDKLTIYYSGFMNPSRVRSLSDYMRINKKDGVYLRSYYYSLWFPVFQNKFDENYAANFREISITLPDNFKGVVSGKLLDETLSENRYTSVWRPGLVKISNIQCTARQYNRISRDNIFLYHLGDNPNLEILDFTEKLKTVFFTNYKNANNVDPLYILEMPEYGNISNQNVIGISTELYESFDKNLGSKLTIAHELVHPYVLIPVTNEHPFSSLIVEGFPSFFHLYGLKKISEGDDIFDLHQYMKRLEKSYLEKKLTGKDRRGNPLPLEKPISKILFEEIGEYKDLFILADRVPLFLYHLLSEMGEENYDRFLKQLFSQNEIDYKKLEFLISKYISGYENNLDIWLNTIEYPEYLKIKN